MKTSYNLTLIGTVLAMSALSLPFIISETSPKPEIPNTFDLKLIDTLVEFGCSELAIYHLMDYSNLLDEEYDGTHNLDWIGLPDGLSKEDFDKCLQIATSIRESNYTTTPELDSSSPSLIVETGPEFNEEFCNAIYSEPLAATDTMETKFKVKEWINLCIERGLLDYAYKDFGISSSEPEM